MRKINDKCIIYGRFLKKKNSNKKFIVIVWWAVQNVSENRLIIQDMERDFRFFMGIALLSVQANNSNTLPMDWKKIILPCSREKGPVILLITIRSYNN